MELLAIKLLKYLILLVFLLPITAHALDECEVNADCKACQEDLRCLKCTHYCYNKFGDPYNNQNPFVRSSAQCTELCWEEGDEKKVRKAKKELGS